MRSKYLLARAMGLLTRLAVYASGSVVAAGGAYSYLLYSKQNQRQHAQDVPEGASPALVSHPSKQ